VTIGSTPTCDLWCNYFLDARQVLRQTARIRLVNDTRFAHGNHLHGHHFYELNANGDLGDRRDTTLIDLGETRDIVCVLDNPGKWLLHCHMLGHQAAGMKTWVEIA
jgi:FtsP/CotA-like multicopper oxidase with cupredoxin domain